MAEKPSQGQGSPGSIPRGLINRRGSVIKPSERLPSLRTRDLTLGGIPKKSFKPNIPTRRDKSKDEGEAASSSSSPSTSRRSGDGDRGGRGGRGRGRGKGRGRGRDRTEFIQSHSSIFEGGPTERMNARASSKVFEQPSFRGGGGGGGDGKFSSRGGKGGNKKNMNGTGDFVGDSDLLRELVRDDFISDLGDSTEDDRYQPISLPMAKPFKPLKTQSVKDEKKPIIKEEDLDVKMETDDVQADEDVKVKLEPKDEVDEDMDTSDEKKPISGLLPPVSISDAFQDDFDTGRVTCATIFSRRRKSKEEPLFFQLPDTLPGLPIVEEEEEDKKPTISASGGVEKPSSSSKKRPCTLKDLPEGFLGKLQILKSGKTRLVLTNGVTLDVSMGTPSGFLQDLVSIHIREGGEEMSEMLTLGHIKHRVICTPDFESLLSMPT
ncbi:DNA-directed RNA polymerase III subunit RPC4 isoform X2 [Strongylocentrotus purpuratus]|uniref:DNA-directed RNA polymerase III subunit RPC4 n=1 Tax=Strongylocentrotus purpuratus TaxID=7668 RepID=A0A7M7SSS1_STRPU|nr:DNA-directed RNA polymerase III subunit RPC4 isoform X2 [Strongylocentrotus purpuratus]